MSASLEGRSYLPPEEPLERPCPLAGISLFFGIASWIAFPLLSAIAAIVLGHMARIQIARSEGRLTGDTMAVIGLWLGYANIVFVALIVICLASLFLLPAIGKLFAR
jgi:uncharacterized membrane protein